MQHPAELPEPQANVKQATIWVMVCVIARKKIHKKHGGTISGLSFIQGGVTNIPRIARGTARGVGLSVARI